MKPVANAFGLVLLSIPFVAAQVLATEFARLTTLAKGIVFHAVVLLALGLLYFWGYTNYQEALEKRHWTQAQISMLMLVPLGFLVLLVPGILTRAIMKKRQKTK